MHVIRIKNEIKCCYPSNNQQSYVLDKNTKVEVLNRNRDQVQLKVIGGIHKGKIINTLMSEVM